MRWGTNPAGGLPSVVPGARLVPGLLVPGLFASGVPGLFGLLVTGGAGVGLTTGGLLGEDVGPGSGELGDGEPAVGPGGSGD